MGSHNCIQWTDDGLADLRIALRSDAGPIAEALLGRPSKRSRRELRWGKKGSLSVSVNGPSRGLWHDHEAGVGGDVLSLIQRSLGITFAAALAWARRWTGIDAPDGDDTRPRQPPPPRFLTQREIDAAAEAEEDRRERIENASRIAAVSVPIANTTGATYLARTRGLPADAHGCIGYPAAILWHPMYKAVVAVATTVDGAVHAVQCIYIGTDAWKISDEEVARRKLPAAKATRGVLADAVVRLPGNAGVDGPLVFAEGVETGLAVWISTGYEVWIALGGVGRLQPLVGRQIIVACDDNPRVYDARHGGAAKALRKAVQAWRVAGVDVALATPAAARRYDKHDFADVILAHGPAAVRRRFEAAASHRSTVSRVGMGEGRDQVAKAVDTFFDAVTRSPEDLVVHAVRVTVGAGKSVAARDRIVRQVVGMRARSDERSIAVAVPRHDLGDDYLDALRPALAVHGLVVDTWRGRDAADPTHPGYANRQQSKDNLVLMCRDLERVRDAQSVGLSVQEAVCRRKVIGPDGTATIEACPHSQICGYQAQRQRRADVWIVAHEGIFHEKPAAMGDVAALVVDEAAWAKGLKGVERPMTLTVDALMAEDTLRCDEGRLRDLRRQLQDLLRDLPLGPVRRDAVRKTLLTVESTAEARRLEWRRKVSPMHPGQTTAERKAAMEEAAGNSMIGRLVTAWTAIEALLKLDAPEASGWIELVEEATPEGPVRAMRLKGRRPVAAGWCVPTLILDAILDVSLLTPYWSRAKLVADVNVATPHQRTWQTVDCAYAKSRLEPLDDDDAATRPKEARRRMRRLADVRAHIVKQAVRCRPGQVLVVLQKAVKEALLTMGPLPANVDLAHHNAVAGADQWRDARLVIVVGRTQPGPAAVEQLAEALTGAACTRVKEYDRSDARRETADGRSIPCEADRHPHPVAEAIRWQIAEGEIIQVVGRGRGVNRNASTPLDVLVMTDLALPIPIDGMLTDADLRLSLTDRMLADTGLAPDLPAHAARCHPKRWRTEAAARQALYRETADGQDGESPGQRRVTSPNMEDSIGGCHTPHALQRVAYQVAGPGKAVCYATYAPALCPDPAAALTKGLGALAWHRIEEVPHEASASAPRAARSMTTSSEVCEVSAGQRNAIQPLGVEIKTSVPDPRMMSNFLAAWAREGENRRVAPH